MAHCRQPWGAPPSCCPICHHWRSVGFCRHPAQNLKCAWVSFYNYLPGDLTQVYATAKSQLIACHQEAEWHQWFHHAMIGSVIYQAKYCSAESLIIHRKCRDFRADRIVTATQTGMQVLSNSLLSPEVILNPFRILVINMMRWHSWNLSRTYCDKWLTKWQAATWLALVTPNDQFEAHKCHEIDTLK